jgi:hypothetical protein
VAEPLAGADEEINDIDVSVLALGDAVLAEHERGLHERMRLFGAFGGAGELVGRVESES